MDAAIAATEGKVNLALVDIDNLSDLALDYDVQAVPTVLAVKDGKVINLVYFEMGRAVLEIKKVNTA